MLNPSGQDAARLIYNSAFRRPTMKKFAQDLADFLRRHYPEAGRDGWYRFSADLRIMDGEVDVEIPILTRLPDVQPQHSPPSMLKDDPLKAHLPRDRSN
jgi:hypothetical protein